MSCYWVLESHGPLDGELNSGFGVWRAFGERPWGQGRRASGVGGPAAPGSRAQGTVPAETCAQRVGFLQLLQGQERAEHLKYHLCFPERGRGHPNSKRLLQNVIAISVIMGSKLAL